MSRTRPSLALPPEFYETLSANARAVVRAAAEGIVRRRKMHEELSRSWVLDAFSMLVAREALADGEYGAWRHAATGFSEKVARNLVSAAGLMRAHEVGPENYSGVHPRVQSVVVMLAEGATPQVVRDVYMPRVAGGERVSLAEVRVAIRRANGVEDEQRDEDAPSPPIEAPSVAPVPCLTATAPGLATIEPAAGPVSPTCARASAITEVARMVRGALGHDGLSVANLIRHGLGGSLADAIETECGHLGEAQVRLEANGVEDAPPPKLVLTSQGVRDLSSFVARSSDRAAKNTKN